MKTDFKWRETGNVAIEQVALAHSKSEYFVYKLHGGKGLYLLPRYMIAELYRHGRVVKGGNQMHNLSLVSVKMFIKYATKLVH